MSTIMVMAYCYAELTVSSLMVGITIASIHYAYLWRYGWYMFMLCQPGCLKRHCGIFANGHPSHY